MQKLPVEAQYSTVNGIIVSDFDSDGDQDMLLGGNMFGSEVETTRGDASYGLMLSHEANNEYTPKGFLQTGFFVPYDVKDMQLIHIGKDKKPAVLVGCNNSALRLFTKNTENLQM